MTRDTFDRFTPPERGLFGDAEHAPRDRVSGASHLVDLDLVLHHQTDKAILVSADGTEARAVWLPKSRVEVFTGNITSPASKRSGQIVRLPVITVTLTEPLAKEKGLI